MILRRIKCFLENLIQMYITVSINIFQVFRLKKMGRFSLFFFFNILVNLEAAKFLLCKTPGKSIVYQQGFMWPLGFGLCHIASS